MFGSSRHPLHHKNGYQFLKIGNVNKTNLVFVHGMFGGLSNFDPLIEYLDNSSIIVPKIPLYEIDKSQLTIPGLAEWLLDFFDAVGIKQSILLGNSMGGHVALEFVHRNPEKVKALILTGSSGLLEHDFGSTFPKRKSREYVKERANMTFYEDLANDVVVDEILDVVNSRAKLSSLLKITRSTHNYSMEEKLPEIEQRTLLVWGKQDVVTPPKVARQFQELLPNAVLRWIDRCGHAPMMERPQQFYVHLKDFLDDLKHFNRTKQQTL